VIRSIFPVSFLSTTTMAAQSTDVLENYRDYIDPSYERTGKYKVETNRANFNAFLNQLLELAFPDAATEKPKNAYNFNAHMGAFVRALDTAKDEFFKASLAYHDTKKRKAASEPEVPVEVVK
jgi:hypothetical protein